MTYVNENIIERDIQRAAQASRAADNDLWVACFFVSRVVGYGIENATKHIADTVGRHPSTVENWAHAYWMYEDLRKFGVASVTLRDLRRMLTPTHFWTAWGLKQKYRMSNKKVMQYLSQLLAHMHNGEPHSADALTREVEATETHNGNRPSWKWYVTRLKSMYINLLAVDVPEPVRDWLKAAPKEIRG